MIIRSIENATINASNNSATAPRATRSGAALGIYTKSSSAPLTNRQIRFQHLSVARKILYEEGVKQGLKYPANYHRTAKCHYQRMTTNVQVFNSEEFKTSFFGGLATCGSVFACRHCASKVQEKRRIEIAQAFDFAYNKLKKKVIMITFTFPHVREDDLKKMILNMRDAFRRLRSGRAWVNFKDAIEFQGLIRSLEVTFSKRNGYHPHTHEAWIVDNDVDTVRLRDDLANRWLKCCQQSGLVSDDYTKVAHFIRHSVDVIDWASNSDYLAKCDSVDSMYWGADRELAKSETKKARKDSFGVFDFLDEYQRTGDNFWRERYLEYVNAMKGSRQIFWSHGLKKRVGLDELSDEELASMKEEKAKLVFELDEHQWRKVADNNLQAAVLDLSESGGKPAVLALLDDYEEKPTAPTTLQHVNEQEAFRQDYAVKRSRMSTSFLDKQYQSVVKALEDLRTYEQEAKQLRESIRDYTLDWYRSNMLPQ